MVTMKTINIRISSDLLSEIDAAASASGMDRSNWLRSAATEKLSGCQPSPSKDTELLSSLKVADERSKAVIRDVLQRLNRLESHCFPDTEADPFA